MQFMNEVNGVLNKEAWKQVNKNLIAKMLAEYMYEDMIKPQITKENGLLTCRLSVSEKKAYLYQAKERYFDSYTVLEDSIRIEESRQTKEAESAVELLTDIQSVIGMTAETTGHLIKEINNTLLADAHLLHKENQTSDELVQMDYAELEGYMTGHPWITYNKGRIGFGYDDYLTYAPESHQEVKLSWIAVHCDRSTFHSIDNENYRKLLEHELESADKSRFDEKLLACHVDPDDYYYMPVHPWQWKNVLVQQFAEDLAMGQIIPLGDGEDVYLPQQSIRTFVNRTNKRKHHVKLPMSILNTLVYRGLPAERTVIAPKITSFIKDIYENDPFLKEECQVILPGEIASINVDHPHYPNVENVPYQYLEMLGAIWRESIYSYLDEDEQAVTLAALLHRDKDGKAFIQSLIEQSDLTSEEWMEKFFHVIMRPLLHYIYRYGVVFSPHGQNVILVLKDKKPHRLAVKDFVDDVNISDQPFEELSGLSDDLKKVLRSEPPEGLTQFIFTGLFICHLRYLAGMMEDDGLLTEHVFWEQLAESIHNYQERFPELKERYKLFDFFKPSFTKLCLNRNRMVNEGYQDGDDRPHASEYGRVKNALAKFDITLKK
ncbi:IucA/IucC family protein [Thalassobacillus pellis]|uniref:IucA/IucC family protein n=1 Tax=Thalassobacillus pellis TaxID=748008 RepID=UPI001961DCED|nr:IucA/IucC family siderophore biosynthesis protein [Thalassobacillus pellis]MBM7553691.1 siderophore synthetase component [Thalassobacillus pellis]